MKVKGKLATCTIAELATNLAERIDFDDNCEPFAKCDFGIITEADAAEDDLEYVRSGVNGWYGIKDIDTGFSSECLVLIADYYGGGCASMSQVWADDLGINYAAHDIEQMLLDTLNTQEVAKPETLLLVEFLGEG